MKRDWDLIREVLIEVESLPESDRHRFAYSLAVDQHPAGFAKSEQALLLWKAGFLEALDVGGLDYSAIQAPELTWQGHDLLDTLRSQPVWERIKIVAKEKGLELTFDAVKAIGRAAIDYVLKQSA